MRASTDIGGLYIQMNSWTISTGEGASPYTSIRCNEIFLEPVYDMEAVKQAVADAMKKESDEANLEVIRQAGAAIEVTGKNADKIRNLIMKVNQEEEDRKKKAL